MAKQHRKKWPSVDVYDPADGQDFRLQMSGAGGEYFSSLRYNCAVVRMSWSSEWSIGFLKGRYVRRIPLHLMDPFLICTTLRNTGTTGFFAISPARRLRVAGVRQPKQYNDSLFVEFDFNESPVASFVSDANSNGSYEEWIVGSAIRNVSPADLVGFDTNRQSLQSYHFLANFEALGCLWTFDFESGEVRAVFRRFSGYRESIRRILNCFDLAIPGGGKW
jgi:hypothetical protein